MRSSASPLASPAAASGRRLPGGRFVTNLLKARLSYSLSPRLYVQALVQHNDVIDNWSTNLRLGWLQTANTGLFVVYNETGRASTTPSGSGCAAAASRSSTAAC